MQNNDGFFVSWSTQPSSAAQPKGRTDQYSVYACTKRPRRSARISAGIVSSYELEYWCASDLALATICRESASSPATAMPEVRLTGKMRLMVPGTSILECKNFSTAKMTPSEQQIASAVPLFSTAFPAYSTWYTRPSGEN